MSSLPRHEPPPDDEHDGARPVVVPVVASHASVQSARRSRARSTTTVALKPADPFELIRWLARSQSDPRKAVAELVQNSLDAGARRIDVHRQRIRKALCLIVRDDGEGVLPDFPREEALRYLATHVGHSRKLGLDPAERHRRVVAGKYGVGLLGFWSIGKMLELRTRVGGSRLYALRLEEDSARAEIEELALRTDAPETFTEAVVIGVHETAQKALGGRRLADYLAAELRGQLLARDVALAVHDHVARGTAQKRFDVVPRRFTGEPLALPSEIEAGGGFAPIRVELYLSRGTDRAAIQVACAGTLVADDIRELGALGLAMSPWVDRDLTGVLDFPSFNVPPGTRRGVMPDAAAAAFAGAIAVLEPLVLAELGRLDAERRSAADRQVLDELRRAMRGFRRRLPQYDLPRVEGTEDKDGERDAGARLATGGDAAALEDAAARTLELFPPGPLESLAIVPPEVALAPGAERRVRAIARDRDRRAIDAASVSFAWRVVDPYGMGLEIRGGDGPRPALLVPAGAPLGAAGEVHVEARQGDAVATAHADVRVTEPEDEVALGIPEPHLVSDPNGTWRSRMSADRWEVNDAHEDYRALRAEPRARLRYLLALLAKEIVLRTTARPDVAQPLEALVEVLAHTERNLRGA